MDLVVELPGGEGEGVCRYRAVAKVGGGSFGDILAAVNEHDPRDWVALKVEACYRASDLDRQHVQPSMVRFEYKVCQELARASYSYLERPVMEPGCGPCPAVRGFTSLHDEHDVLAMELLGPDLRSYADKLGPASLSEGVVLVLGAVLVGRLEQLHGCGFIHRDLKPENMVLRLEDVTEEDPVPCLMLVDYALAMRYATPDLSEHIPERETTDLVGTHRYMAIHAQRGIVQSRRSDMESLAHVLIYLARGDLPWQHLQDPKEVLACKEKITIPELCKDLKSKAFAEFLVRCRSLAFDEAPDYRSLKELLVAGVRGEVVFQANEVCGIFRSQLQKAFFQAQHMSTCLSDADSCAAEGSATNGSSESPCQFWIFVHPGTTRAEGTELVLGQPRRPEDLDDPRSFFFEAFREPQPGTIHVVAGPTSFFAFLSGEALRRAACGRPNGEEAEGERLLLFSCGRRDWLTRASALPAYDVGAGRPYKDWNLRSAFWARVLSASAPRCPAPSSSTGAASSSGSPAVAG